MPRLKGIARLKNNPKPPFLWRIVPSLSKTGKNSKKLSFHPHLYF